MTATELARRPESLDAALVPAVLPQGLRWLALVDGVDEIVEGSTRRAFVLRLARFAEQHQNTHQLLVTTRPLPGEELRTLQAAGLTPYVLEPFDRPRLIDFAERWFGNEKTAADYVRHVDLACLGPLVRVPLLATITAVVYEAYPNNPLPGNQYLLYEQYRRHLARSKENQLSEQWQRLEAAVEDEAPGSAVAVRELAAQRGEALLHHLAVEQTTRGIENLTQTALRWLDEQLDIPASRLVLGWPDHVRGLLASTGMMVRTPVDVQFLHSSFAEHLAAEFRSKQLPDVPSLTDPAWGPVIDRARAHDQASLATLIHAAHRSTGLAKALLTKLQAGTGADRLVAAHLLAEGPILDDAHAQWFVAQLDGTDPDLDPDWWRLAARIGHPEVTERLTELACQPGERRYAAAAALAAHRPAAAGTELLNLVLAAEEPWATRCDAVRTLARLGDRRSRQAAQALREQLLEGPRDRFNRESAVSVLTEVYTVGELESFFRGRVDRSDGSVDFVVLSVLAAVTDEHCEEVRDRLVSLIGSVGTESVVDHAVETLVELPGSVGEAALLNLIASARRQLPLLLRLASKGITAGVNQEEILSALLQAASQSPPYEICDDREVFILARSFSVLLGKLHEDVSPSLLALVQENVWSVGRYVPAHRGALVGFMVAGWELMAAYDWNEPWDRPGGFEAARCLLADMEMMLLPPRRNRYDASWKDFRIQESSWAARIWLGQRQVDLQAWGERIGLLGSDATSANALVDIVAAFTREPQLPEAGRAAVLLVLVLLLCATNSPMDSGQRAAHLRKLGMHYPQHPALCEYLKVIAEAIEVTT
ncbi:NACHT domain-containing protein [Streptomyces cinerochromogenes]|uniref:NACHT domain-containing protein n=1 Tax=Streptomyces cinerochromogenes TaxID=66422 RepID=UPI0036AAC2CA